MNKKYLIILIPLWTILAILIGITIWLIMNPPVINNNVVPTEEAMVTFTPRPTFTPTPTPSPTPMIEKKITKQSSDATTIELAWDCYDEDTFEITTKCNEESINVVSQVDKGECSIGGLKSGRSYTVTIVNTRDNTQYLEPMTFSLTPTGYGDPFKSIYTKLNVGETSKWVRMTSEKGSFDAKAWPNFETALYEEPELKNRLQSVAGGTPLVVTTDGEGHYCYCRSANRWSLYVKTEDGKTGWINADVLFVDITDLFDTHNNIYGIQINRTNAYSSIFTAGGSSTGVDTVSDPSTRFNSLESKDNIFTTTGFNEIKGITGMALANYGSEAQMPLIWDLALELIQSQKNALENGVGLLIYDGYRPNRASLDVSESVKGNNYLAQTSNGRNLANGYLSGGYSWTAYIAKYSRHNKGIAVDITISDFPDVDNSGKELAMQTKMHTLDYRCNVYYNNDNAKLLADIMLEKTNLIPIAGKQEWWHFELPIREDLYPQINNYKYVDYKI